MLHMENFPVESLLAGIRSWVEIESPTDDITAVNRMADRIEGDYRAAGAKVNRIAGGPSAGDHLLASMPNDNGDPGILLISHHDTVHPIGTLTGLLPFKQEGDKAYGPGIADMKGGAYLAFAAFRTILESSRTTHMPVRHLFVSDEETGSVDSRPIIEAEARRAKYVLVTEPARNGGLCVTARSGIAGYRITAVGRATHAGLKHAEGRNAIREIAKQVLDIESMTDYARGLTLNVGKIQGGTRPNVVPRDASIDVDIRVPSHKIYEEIHAKLTGLISYDPDVRLSIEGVLKRPPYEKTPQSEELFCFVRDIATGCGLVLKDTATAGGSDANFASAFAPVLDGLGADGGDSSHTDSEHIILSSLSQRALLLSRALMFLQ